MKNGNLFRLFFYRGYIVRNDGDIILVQNLYGIKKKATFEHLVGELVEMAWLLGAAFGFSSFCPFKFRNTFWPCLAPLVGGRMDHLFGKKLF